MIVGISQKTAEAFHLDRFWILQNHHTPVAQHQDVSKKQHCRARHAPGHFFAGKGGHKRHHKRHHGDHAEQHRDDRHRLEKREEHRSTRAKRHQDLQKGRDGKQGGGKQREPEHKSGRVIILIIIVASAPGKQVAQQ